MGNRLWTFQTTGSARNNKNSTRKRWAARLKLRVPAGAREALKKGAQSAGQGQRQTNSQQGAGSIRET